MLRGEPFTAIIPVRGGSKGIPRKNLRAIGGMSLLERAIRFAKASPRFERVIVSTDDEEMQALASRLGAASPTLRPQHLATDTATAAEVVNHVLAEHNITTGYICIVQATSPFRRLSDLEAMCKAFEASQASASVSLASVDEPRPEKLKKIVDGQVRPYMAVSHEGPRQSLPQPYRLNGAFYIIGIDPFKAGQRFLTDDCLPFVMADAHSHNLDSLTDWQIMEAMIAAGHWSFENYA